MAEERIETAFPAAIESGKLNGAYFGATDSQGSFTYEEVMGQRFLVSGEKRPVQPDDILYLASATKLMTLITALQCVEEGLLTLDGDLSAFAPELAAKKVLVGWSEDDEPVLEPQTRPITLRMLLTHSAGVDYHFLNPDIQKWHNKFITRPSEPGEEDKLTVEDTFTYPLTYQPGEGWMYGPGLDWAGRIVERATGKTLGDRMHERLFGPLGITDAKFYPVTDEKLRQRLVDLSPDDPEGLGKAVLGGSGDMNKMSKGDFGGHGLFMTGPDYLKVLHSVLANDGKVLKQATVNSMFEHQLTPASTASFEAALETPMGPFFRVGTYPDSKVGYGLGGILTLEDVEGWYGSRTLSWGGGLTFAWFIDRKNDYCGAGALQARLPTDMAAIMDLKQTFRHDVYRKREAWKKQKTT